MWPSPKIFKAYLRDRLNFVVFTHGYDSYSI